MENSLGDSLSLTGSISTIPIEVVENILGRQVLKCTDVCNFASTCSKFWELVNRYGNQIWKVKYKQMWPKLASNDYYKKHEETDWLREFRQRWLMGRQAMRLVNGMSARHIKQDELSSTDFYQFEQIVKDSGHKLALKFMIDELMQFIHNTNRNCNLTNKYYCEKVLRHLRQLDLAKKWEEFNNDPPHKQILERGAVIIAQWGQPTEEITDQFIGSQFDSIAEDVLKQIQVEHGDKHLALCVPIKEQMSWRTHNLEDNYYSPYVCRQILAAVSFVLFMEMGFHGDTSLYYCQENSHINKVLVYRKGIPITLSILFESVCRRLGVKCEPVSFPGHFLLRWRDTYKLNASTQYFYIDVFNGGTFMGKESCPQFAKSQGRCPMGDIFQYGPASPLQVMERMAYNLEVAGRQRTTINGRTARLRSALELLNMLNPNNVNCLTQLARFYMQHNMNVSALKDALDRTTQVDLRDMGQASFISRSLVDYENNNYIQHLQESTKALEVKKREGCEVKYSVGLVMHHHLYNYSCVIVGWDQICEASQDWVVQMNVRNLSRQHLQPFYNVLVDDGTNRYAAEDNLRLEQANSNGVDHCEVGRYFKEFRGTHYLLNEVMLQAYPDDLAVTMQLLNGD